MIQGNDYNILVNIFLIPTQGSLGRYHRRGVFIRVVLTLTALNPQTKRFRIRSSVSCIRKTFTREVPEREMTTNKRHRTGDRPTLTQVTGFPPKGNRLKPITESQNCKDKALPRTLVYRSFHKSSRRLISFSLFYNTITFKRKEGVTRKDGFKR